MIDNSGKVAVVFGVRNDSSLAWNIATQLQKSGCKVAFNYLPDTRDEVLHLIKSNGFNPELAFQADVRNDEEIARGLKMVSDALGEIHYILHGVAFGNQQVMCSTLPGSTDEPKSYIDIPFDDLVDSFNISAYSLMRICRLAEPLLAKNASILTLTYNASQRVFPNYAGMAINKAALENIMLYLANYFRKDAVRVNAISAGLVMTTSAGGVSGVRNLRKIGKATAPLGNIDAGDVANAALYYFSDLSKKVTGNIHFVDGGFNIMGVSADGA